MIDKKTLATKKIIKKKNGVIRAKSDFFRSARYGLTLQEHRIVYYAILHGQQEGKSFEPVTMSIKDFQALFEVAGNSYYSVIRNLSNNIAGKIVEVAYKDSDGHHLMQAAWLSSVTYHAKSGTVTISPNKALQPFFEGKPFTDTEFAFLIKFTSQYAERLYELLKTFAFKSIVDFDVEDLRNRLAVGTKYKNFSMLKDRVLQPAIDDVNKFTDLDVDIREKRGLYNKVDKVIFSIQQKNIPKLAKRMDKSEYITPLSDAEQERFVSELTGEPQITFSTDIFIGKAHD